MSESGRRPLHSRRAQGDTPWKTPRQHRRLFFRFLAGLALAALIFTGWTASLSFVLGRPMGLEEHARPGAAFAFALIITVLLPLLVITMLRQAYRYFLVPLSDIISGADAVAAGNLAARVLEPDRGPLHRLALAFNRMTGELELADRRRRNLTADVAHELRTPLHIIQGNLEGVLDGVYQPARSHIEATLAETKALARLIEDLRVLSLAEAGELPLAQESVDVVDLLTDVQTSFSAQAEVAGVKLWLQLPDNRPAVYGDAGRLDQVLSNLVANALRYTPAGGEVTLAATVKPGAVEISVKDTGQGIAREDLPYVFDRFWKGDAARQRNAGGSGLGLAIVKQLVRAHKGTIEVESTVGQGTCFTVTLPAQH